LFSGKFHQDVVPSIVSTEKGNRKNTIN